MSILDEIIMPIPTHVDYPENSNSLWNIIPVGIGANGQEIVINVKSTPNILLTGSAGSGKSVMQRNFLAHCLKNPEHWNVMGFDFKRIEMKKYENLAPVITRIATSVEEGFETVTLVHDEMKRRYADMAFHGVNSFEDLPNAPKALLLILDELFFFLAPDYTKGDIEIERLNELRLQAQTMIEELSRLGFASGIYMLLSTQRPSADVVSRTLKGNLDCRIVCGQVERIASMMSLDNDNATNISRYIRGRSYIQHFGEGQEFQPYFIPWNGLPTTVTN